MEVLVAGGSGFVGRSLCRVLADRGHRVTAASRSPSADGLPDDVETLALDVTRPDLADAVAGHDAVVNLVALPSHRAPRGAGHEAVHLEGTRHLLAASEDRDVSRFVQMSGLGVDAGIDTAYFRAKRGAEALVRDADLEWVIYRPSVVFGDGCAFLPFLDGILPPLVAPLPGGGEMKLQPIWVEDLAPMLADGVDGAGHAGGVYRLGGPEALSMRRIVEHLPGRRRVVPIPMGLARAGFALAEVIPSVPVGLDQYRVFRHDNTVEGNGEVGEGNDVTSFGRDPGDLRSLADYLDSHD